MSRKLGFDLLEEQASARVREMVNSQAEDISGDSEIERLFLLALFCHCTFGTCEYRDLVELEIEEEPPLDPVYSPSQLNLYVKKQVQLPGWRVDFVIYAFDFRPRILKRPGWRKLIVECDGHDFHERTKEQAKRDRSRDRKSILNGQEAIRFTGSELWNDPWGCAEEIVDWGTRSFG